MLISLTLKIITLPLLFILFSWTLPSLSYDNRWIAVLTITILITVGIPMEKLLLKKKTFWIVLLMDFLSTMLIIWVAGAIFQQVVVEVTAALLLSLFISLAEYFVHRLLLTKEKPIRQPN